VLLKLLTGSTPTLKRGLVPPPKRVAGGVGPLLKRLLSKDPEGRPASAAELRTALAVLRVRMKS
jgi:hypothetical protein